MMRAGKKRKLKKTKSKRQWAQGESAAIVNGVYYELKTPAGMARFFNDWPELAKLLMAQ